MKISYMFFSGFLILGLFCTYTLENQKNEAHAQEIGFAKYENLERNVSVLYPEKWVQRPAGLGTIVGFYSILEDDLDYSEHVILGMQPLLKPLTLEEIVNNNVSTLEEQSRGFNLITVEPTILANQSATKIIYELTNSEKNLKGMLIIALKGEYEYYLVYGAESKNFEKYLSYAEVMSDSFAILDNHNDSENDKDYTIPSWLRNNARWWGEGQIGDQVFFNSLQYLLDKKIIQVSEPTHETLNILSQGSLDWAKGNSLRWSWGEITTDDFIILVQFFIENKFIVK